MHNHKQRLNVPLSPAAVAFDTEDIGHVGNIKIHSEYSSLFKKSVAECIVEQVQIGNVEEVVTMFWFGFICPIRGKLL